MDRVEVSVSRQRTVAVSATFCPPFAGYRMGEGSICRRNTRVTLSTRHMTRHEPATAVARHLAASVPSPLPRQPPAPCRVSSEHRGQRRPPSTLQNQFRAPCSASHQAPCRTSSRRAAPSVPSPLPRQFQARCSVTRPAPCRVSSMHGEAFVPIQCLNRYPTIDLKIQRSLEPVSPRPTAKFSSQSGETSRSMVGKTMWRCSSRGRKWVMLPVAP